MRRKSPDNPTQRVEWRQACPTMVHLESRVINEIISPDEPEIDPGMAQYIRDIVFGADLRHGHYRTDDDDQFPHDVTQDFTDN